MKLNTLAPKRRIFIPATAQHHGHDGVSIETEWQCLVCGGERGTPFKAASYDGSLRLDGVDSWKNPCGHQELYEHVRIHEMHKGYTRLINAFKEALVREYGEACLIMHVVCKRDFDTATIESFLNIQLDTLKKQNPFPLSLDLKVQEAEIKEVCKNLISVFRDHFAFIQ